MNVLTSNSIGTNEVFRFCMKNKIKLVYSATSASLGNEGNDKKPYLRMHLLRQKI